MQRILLLLAVPIFAGCFLDTTADCANLCDRYEECFDMGSDIEDCTARCQSRVDEGEDDRADACDACLDDNPMCATAVSLCTADCGPLLAP